MEKLLSRNSLVIVIAVTKRSIKIPAQEVSGPGMTGRKLPAIPNKIKMPAIKINKKSKS